MRLETQRELGLRSWQAIELHKSISRRDAVKHAAAILVAGMVARPGPVRAAYPAMVFSPPESPMVFTRRLTRELSDGEKIIVERGWQIRFLREQGFIVSGSQVSVDVEAPEKLAALKRMEEAKIERGLFPLRLSDNGTITDNRAPSHQQAVQDAIEFAKRRVEDLGASAAAYDAKRFLAAIQNATAEHMSRLPRDLFAPQQLDASEEQDITLPNGDTGSVRISFTAEISGKFGLLERAERTVTTTLGEESRASGVQWTLVAV